MAVTEASKSFWDVLKDRAVSPLMGAFIISWAVFNYEFLLITLSKADIDKTLELIGNMRALPLFDEKLADYKGWMETVSWLWFYGRFTLIPLVITFIFYYLYPIPANHIYKKNLALQKSLATKKLEHQKELDTHEIKLKIDLETEKLDLETALANKRVEAEAKLISSDALSVDKRNELGDQITKLKTESRNLKDEMRDIYSLSVIGTAKLNRYLNFIEEPIRDSNGLNDSYSDQEIVKEMGKAFLYTYLCLPKVGPCCPSKLNEELICRIYLRASEAAFFVTGDNKVPNTFLHLCLNTCDLTDDGKFLLNLYLLCYEDAQANIFFNGIDTSNQDLSEDRKKEWRVSQSFKISRNSMNDINKRFEQLEDYLLGNCILKDFLSNKC